MTTITSRTFLLVAIGLGEAKEIKRGTAQLVQSFKKAFKKLPQWKDYVFQVRTPEGFKNVKVLYKDGKIKK